LDTNNRLATANFHCRSGGGVKEFDLCFKILNNECDISLILQAALKTAEQNSYKSQLPLRNEFMDRFHEINL